MFLHFQGSLPQASAPCRVALLPCATYSFSIAGSIDYRLCTLRSRLFATKLIYPGLRPLSVLREKISCIRRMQLRSRYKSVPPRRTTVLSLHCTHDRPDTLASNGLSHPSSR
ncbi:hypothetical protein BOTBODRAFT_251096 [Botryobasidium botryosum FD-172 SS1]|uniref:Uncharacterized protein n=1 Tax=Botryobasidium botryosum (strain FD-172 SS1) TaxID=930990 RepID=A0A067MP54_BOTB1|nr:hypothetical protein BOTBODRAFT_251096 [Botryobasidium botryosum FD-172 SS1]